MKLAIKKEEFVNKFLASNLKSISKIDFKKLLEKLNFSLLLVVILSFSYLNINILNYSEGQFEEHFLNVGQGDSILIITPKRRLILIDTGRKEEGTKALSEVLPFYQNNIEYLILTHMDTDHSGGAIDILKRYEVKNLIINPSNEDAELFNEIANTAYQRGTNIKPSLSYDPLEIDDVSISFLFPLEGSFENTSAKDNDLSISVKVSYKSFDTVLTGDLPIEGEEKILAGWSGLESEVLKLGHHGSKYSSSEEFIAEINPQAVIVSAGIKNPYGHPNPELIERIKEKSIKIYDTRVDGTVSFYTKDGINIYRH